MNTGIWKILKLIWHQIVLAVVMTESSEPSHKSYIFHVSRLYSSTVQLHKYADYTLPAQIRNIWIHNGNSCLGHLDSLEVASPQPQTCIMAYMQLSCVVLWTKNGIRNVWNQWLTNNKGIYRNVSFFNTSPNLSYTFQGIHHYIVKLLNCCVYSIIHYWHDANFATGCQKTIWALNQDQIKWLLRYSNLPFCIIIKCTSFVEIIFIQSLKQCVFQFH